MPASFIIGVILAAIAATPEEPPTPAGSPRGDAGTLTLRAVEARTGEPLEGVSVSYQGRFDGKFRKATVSTDRTGTVVITWPSGAKVKALNFTATRPKFAPIHVNWGGRAHEVTIPSEKVLRFETGVSIGGIVKNEAGTPIAGTTVTVYSPATESDQANYAFLLGTPKTGNDGRWQLDEAPKNLAELWVRAEHPDYRKADGPATRNLDSVIVLTKGLSVSGVVTDSEGRPVKGARATVGFDIWGSPEKSNATTDDQGKFTIHNAEAGMTIVTVQADGFAPQFRDANIGGPAEPLVFRLERGSVLRVRVVDVKGQPIARAFFAPDTWRGHRSIMDHRDTNAEGLVEWRSAPSDEVLYDVGKLGYMSRRGVPLTAGDGVQTVTLYPLLAVSGRVTDAKMGKPIEEFRLVQGQRFAGREQISWSRGEAATFRNGRYKVFFSEPSDALFVRVEAPGFKPADSRPFKPDEGEQSLDFSLERADGSTGVVLLPDGRPAPGVEVAVGTQTHRVFLRSGRLRRDQNMPMTTTGANGLFQFSPPDEPFLLVAAGEAGFAEVTSEEFTKSGGLIDLAPWGKLEGTLMVGGKPGAGLPVVFLGERSHRAGGFGFSDNQYTTETVAGGKFAFDRVVPGLGTVARVIVTELGGGSWQHRYGWQEPVDILPGGTARVRIGGKGRPVIGRVVIEGRPGALVGWRSNEPVTLNPATREGERGVSMASYAANLDRDGQFRIDDVPAGRYLLTVTVNDAKVGQRIGPGTEIGKASLFVEVTEEPGAGAIDLGDVTVKVQDAKP